jgi:sec-independent protein translocase protein TatC
MTLLARAGMITSKGMSEKRKYAIVIAFIVAAILTPPDVISQIGLALPTLGLYEISILCVRIVERSRARAAQEAEREDDAEAAEQKNT